MQALVWDWVRAFTKFGTAIAASNPMIATTIMISINVKPCFNFFILALLVLVLIFSLRRLPESERQLRISIRSADAFEMPFIGVLIATVGGNNQHSEVET